jgi:hypothetical protein
MRTKVKTQPQTKQQTSDAAWLQGLLRQANVPVRPGEALIPVDGSLAAIDSHQALASSRLRTWAEQIVRRAQAHKLPLFPVAVAPLFSGWRLHTQSPRYDYVFCHLAEDPLLHPPRPRPLPHPLADSEPLRAAQPNGPGPRLRYALHRPRGEEGSRPRG